MNDIFDDFYREKLKIPFSDFNYLERIDISLFEEPKEENINDDSFSRGILTEPNLHSEITAKSTFYKNIFSSKVEIEKKEKKNDYVVVVDKTVKNVQFNDIKESKNDILVLRKKRGRYRTTGSHNKFSDDNIRRKIKHLILQNLFIFINKKIKKIYKNDIGKGIFEKKLLKINQKQKSEASIEYNQKFIYKSLGDIFSENITSRYTNFPPTQNKRVIEELKNDEELGNPTYFRNLFNLSFLDCLKHFRRDTHIKELEGLEGIETLKDKIKDDKEYMKSLEYYISNFETIINNKKGRTFKKRENKEK